MLHVIRTVFYLHTVIFSGVQDFITFYCLQKNRKKVAFFNIVIFPIYLKEKQFTELSFIATGNNDLAKNIFLTNFAFKSAKNLNPIRQYIPS